MNIPWAIPNIEQDDIDYLKKVLESKWYSQGKITELFEKNMAKYVGVKYALAVNNGTSALEVLLRALGIKEGDEVIIPAYSYIASATAVSLVGANPLFADVDESMTINHDEIDRIITNRTKAIMCVDLTGNPCNYDLLMEKSKRYNIPLIIDGAQSLGSKYKGKSCLSFGIASTTSFHSAKILTTIEGGMIFTNNSDLYQKLKSIKNQGESAEKYIHDSLGGNYRITDIASAFGIKQLERFDKTIAERKRKVELYKQLLNGYVEFLNENKNGTSCNFIFPIFVKEPDRLCEFLRKNGIETRRIYPRTIPKQPVYKINERFPISEKFCKECVSLPLYNSLKDEEISYICDRIKEFLKK